MGECVFCRIARGDIPADKLYEDEEVVAFKDLHPLAPVHFLVIPKEHIASLAELAPRNQALIGKAMMVAARLAEEQGCSQGFRTIINTGRVGGQEIFHLHVHVLGGPDPLPAMLKF